MIVIEHDPMLYEDAQGMVEHVSQGLHDAAKEAAILLYSPGTDTFLEDMTRNADRVFYFDDGPRATTKLISKAYPKAQKSQTTLEAWRHDQMAAQTRAKPLKPRPMVNPRLLELQTAKQILEEIFHARPSDIDEMIRMRLEEKNWSKESWREEEESWPREFCLGE